MKKAFSLTMLALAFLLAAATLASADSVTIGNYGGDNCFPYGCAEANGLVEYQEHFLASAFGFTSPEEIDSFTVFQSVGTQVQGATYNVYLAYAANPLGADSSTLSDNIGADDTLFATFTVVLSIPSSLTVTGNAPFLYDPSQGDLILDLFVSNRQAGSSGFFEADSSSDVITRAFSEGGFSAANGVNALVTQFDFEPASTVTTPEPGTLAALGTGLLGMVRLLRRKRP